MMNNQEVQTFGSVFKDPIRRKVLFQKIIMFIGKLLRAIILLGLCFVILLPIIEKLSAALRHPTDITNSQVIWIPAQFSIINFQVAAEMLNYGESFINSIIISTITTVIQVIATAIAGYAFARLKFKGNGLIFYIILFTLIVPNAYPAIAVAIT